MLREAAIAESLRAQNATLRLRSVFYPSIDISTVLPAGLVLIVGFGFLERGSATITARSSRSDPTMTCSAVVALTERYGGRGLATTYRTPVRSRHDGGRARRLVTGTRTRP